jgi:multidrug transporter EmrE-like cation transporter
MGRMTVFALCQLAAATGIFIAAASVAKSWALAPALGTAVLTLALYTVGNLLMLNLVRLIGMAVAFSVSAVLQLVAVNLVAVVWFGERLSAVQGVGVVLAIVAVVLVTVGPSWIP